MIAFTTLCYSLGKQHGVLEAAELIESWLAAGTCAMPWMQTLKQLQLAYQPGQVALYYDTGGSHLGQARSRTFHWARKVNDSSARMWITCDDDVQLDHIAAQELVRALSVDEPRIIAVPCIVRGGEHVDVMATPNYSPDGLKRLVHGGMGCVGINRLGLDAIARFNTIMQYTGEMGPDMLAMFHDILSKGNWYGEDVSFWMRVPGSVSRLALTKGSTTHAGAVLNLGSWGAP
jgi:hypothetical protein